MSSYAKIDVLEALQTAESLIKSGHAPCSACRGVLLCVSLEAKKAEIKAGRKRPASPACAARG